MYQLNGVRMNRTDELEGIGEEAVACCFEMS
jgi:hypothetical protein